MALIRREDAIDAVAFDITFAKAFDKETGEVKELFKRENDALKKAIDRIKELSSIDAVEVVRCKDCKYYGKGNIFEDETFMDCKVLDRYLKDDNYCSFAERRTDE